MVELTKDSEKIPTLNKGMLNNDLKDKGLILENLIPNQFMSFGNRNDKFPNNLYTVRQIVA